MLMTRLLALAAALAFATPAVGAEGRAPDAPASDAAEPTATAAPVAKKMRRVQKLSTMKIKGRAMKPHIDVVVSRSRLHFEPGTIQYQYRRKSFERFR